MNCQDPYFGAGSAEWEIKNIIVDEAAATPFPSTVVGGNEAISCHLTDLKSKVGNESQYGTSSLGVSFSHHLHTVWLGAT